MSLPKSITIDVDSRENYPLLFPRTLRVFPDRSVRGARLVTLKVRKLQLREGDVRLARWPKCAGIECKRSIAGELHKNFLTGDYARSHDALYRFSQSFAHPYLLLDGSPSELFSGPPANTRDNDLVVDCVLRECVSLGIHLLWIGPSRSTTSRRIVGETIVRLLLWHALGTPTLTLGALQR